VFIVSHTIDALSNCVTYKPHVHTFRLMGLQYTALQKEGDMRFALVRVRENCESIAFYDGHAAEATYVDSRFKSVINIMKGVIRWTSLLALWRNMYTYATILVPSVVTAPRYFRGEIQFGVVSQVCHSLAPAERTARHLSIVPLPCD
jgi:ABC-type uncharacterized transport system fused permease/ATPase subunit